MKMETIVGAPVAGVVKRVMVKVGDVQAPPAINPGDSRHDLTILDEK